MAEGGRNENPHHMIRLVADLLMGEAELGQSGGGVSLVAEPVPRLLGGRAVIAKPVSLDDETEVGPVEVDFEVVDPLARERDRQAGFAREREEEAFELLLGEAKGAPVKDGAEAGDARLALALLKRLSQFGRMDEVIFVRLVDHPLEAAPVQAQRHVDDGLDRRRDRDALARGGVVPGIERGPAVNPEAWATPARRAG